MIEISHQQARRLLHRHLDERLPNDQWMVLQAHLETCETCRAYNESLNRLEKSLRRSLRGALENIPEPPAGAAGHIHRVFQHVRPRQRKRLLVAGAAAFLILLLVLLGGPAGIRARLSAARADQETASGTAQPAALADTPTPIVAQPTVEPGQFADVIAYEGRRAGLPNGDREIFLLNPGSALVNLTNHPAQDTDPAWSPDGEWLAFLSDREQKSEVYVTNITGSRVVRLTEEAGVTWQGPLSWSPDGKWIALTGIRDQQGSQNWVYLVALDGTGARSLAGSRGGNTPKFSPDGSRIAYRFNDGIHEGIIVQDQETGDQFSARWLENPLVPTLAHGSAFDWSPDGAGLAYVSASPNPVASLGQPAGDAPQPSGSPGSQVIAVPEISARAMQGSASAGGLQIDSSRWPGGFRGVTWSPDGAVVYLEDLSDARAREKPETRPEGCLTIQVNYAAQLSNNRYAIRSASFGGLCVAGGLDQSSWTADGGWIVVQGRLPAEDRPSIYGLRVPGSFRRGRGLRAATPTPTPDGAGSVPLAAQDFGPGTILRLSDDPWAGPLPSPRPRLNPSASFPAIDPQPVETPRSSLPSSNLSDGRLSGKVSYVVQNQNMSWVVSANPDGTGGSVLLASQDVNRCPVWSPDGREVALVQVSGGRPPPQAGAGEEPLPGAISTAGVENIFVLDALTRKLRQVSLLDTLPGSDPQPGQIYYGCPVWSPGGDAGESSLAVLVSDGQKSFLAVLPAGPERAAAGAPSRYPRYLSVPSPDWSLPPVWSPDGEKIFLLHSEASGEPPGMTVINVPADPLAPLTTIAQPPSWQSRAAPGVAILPDGSAMVQLEISGIARAAHLHSILFSTTGGANETGPAVYLTRGPGSGQPQVAQILSGSLTWLSRGTFGIILHAGPQDAVKTLFYLYDLASDRAQPVAAVEDAVSSAAWSPDGNWLIYSAESGLWGVDVKSAVQGKVSPVWLSPQPVQDLDWK